MASDLHVLIIGAGAAGLMLGLLLERADISYEVSPLSCDKFKHSVKMFAPKGNSTAAAALFISNTPPFFLFEIYALKIFEKTKELRPLGSGIALSALSPLFEQLGMWDELQAISKPFGALHLKNEDMTEIGAFRARGEGVFDVKEV